MPSESYRLVLALLFLSLWAVTIVGCESGPLVNGDTYRGQTLFSVSGAIEGIPKDISCPLDLAVIWLDDAGQRTPEQHTNATPGTSFQAVLYQMDFYVPPTDSALRSDLFPKDVALAQVVAFADCETDGVWNRNGSEEPILGFPDSTVILYSPDVIDYDDVRLENGFHLMSFESCAEDRSESLGLTKASSATMDIIISDETTFVPDFDLDCDGLPDNLCTWLATSSSPGAYEEWCKKCSDCSDPEPDPIDMEFSPEDVSLPDLVEFDMVEMQDVSIDPLREAKEECKYLFDIFFETEEGTQQWRAAFAYHSCLSEALRKRSQEEICNEELNKYIAARDSSVGGRTVLELDEYASSYLSCLGLQRE